jgi:hypothetical protein
MEENLNLKQASIQRSMIQGNFLYIVFLHPNSCDRMNTGAV